MFTGELVKFITDNCWSSNVLLFFRTNFGLQTLDGSVNSSPTLKRIVFKPSFKSGCRMIELFHHDGMTTLCLSRDALAAVWDSDSTGSSCPLQYCTCISVRLRDIVAHLTSRKRPAILPRSLIGLTRRISRASSNEAKPSSATPSRATPIRDFSRKRIVIICTSRTLVLGVGCPLSLSS